VRAEYLYDLQSHHGDYEGVVVFGLASIHGRALGFHTITEQGAQIARLPISALVHKEHDPHLPLHSLQMWDAFSYQVSVHQFTYLNLMRCQVILRDRQIFEGTYHFTVDWCGNNDSEDPGEGGHKNAHIIALDCGCFAAQPNNRIIWKEPSFLTNTVRPELGERPEYLTNSHTWKCEIDSKWSAEDSYKMFYEDNLVEPGEKLTQADRVRLARLRVLRDTNYPPHEEA
jgi:hypothetical protein